MFLHVYNTAQNMGNVNGNNADLNLKEHPILPLPQNNNVDNSGKILPVAFARNFDEDLHRYVLKWHKHYIANREFAVSLRFIILFVKSFF